MFRSYDHLQAENIYWKIALLTTDPLFSDIINVRDDAIGKLSVTLWLLCYVNCCETLMSYTQQDANTQD
jgi:hypothetical protein